jgi:hypothetical protein
MAKGQQKSGRENKKPKQDKADKAAPKSEYAKSMSTKSAAPAFGAKK